MGYDETLPGYNSLPAVSVGFLVGIVRSAVEAVADDDASPDDVIASCTDSPPETLDEVAELVCRGLRRTIHQRYGADAEGQLLRSVIPSVRRAYAAAQKAGELAADDAAEEGALGVVLLAHSDDESRLKASMLLDAAEYHVVTARDGGEALYRSVRRRPDVVVASSSLRGVDGVGVAKLLRSAYGGKAPPMVLLADAPPEGEKLWVGIVRDDAIEEKLVSTVALLAY